MRCAIQISVLLTYLLTYLHPAATFISIR